MRNELDQKLCADYPKIFANRFGDLKETAMCWGFECGDGWYNILNVLCANIQHHIDWRRDRRESMLKDNPYNQPVPDEIPQVIVDQVKEKFGTLRFYYHGGDDKIDGMVRMAESISAFTCEKCGSAGKMRGRGWLYTACDEHTKGDDI
jgi:hypothetical protein